MDSNTSEHPLCGGPSHDELIAYRVHMLPVQRQVFVERHLRECKACTAAMVALSDRVTQARSAIAHWNVDAHRQSVVAGRITALLGTIDPNVNIPALKQVLAGWYQKSWRELKAATFLIVDSTGKATHLLMEEILFLLSHDSFEQTFVPVKKPSVQGSMEEALELELKDKSISIMQSGKNEISAVSSGDQALEKLNTLEIIKVAEQNTEEGWELNPIPDASNETKKTSASRYRQYFLDAGLYILEIKKERSL